MIKELFAPTLNRITVMVRCVSSMAVVVNAELDWLRREKTERNGEERRNPKRVTFLA